LKLLDNLEDLVDRRARHVFHRAWGVDLDSFFTLTNQIRAALPEEVKKAVRITEESGRIIAGAHEEADRIVGEAKEHAALLVSNDEITRQATHQAEDIISRAMSEAADIRAGAEDYARRVVANLEDFAARVLDTIRQGRTQLEASASRPAGGPGKSPAE
jgi:cell division septum initiation protein DivIVA